MTLDKDPFQKNCERWSLFCPQAACLVPSFSAFNTYTPKDFTPEEMDAWCEKLDFHAFKLLYVYGLNKALPYAALKAWCREEGHTLVILEDDLEAIAYFLKSEEAEELLNDKNAWLFYLDPSRRALAEITKLFTNVPYTVATIHAEEQKLKTVEELKSQIAFFYNLHTSQLGEFSNYSVVFFNNYFRNLFSLPENYFANALHDQFKGVPAIICGAGPSLGKNIETLKELKDRALIIAGGSSINALNGMNMTPHLGSGIDPNEEQISRIIANTSFEIPFLFRGRIHHKALELISSDKVYVSGSIGYNIAKYFESELHLEGKDVEEGCNVINFSLALAAAMGCNPIILVGVDLAYSEDQTYAPGMVNHPIHKQFRSKIYAEELIFRSDIHGKPVPTLWKWVTESLWFSTFAEQNPTLKIINATEGGLGFAGIPNIPLKEVASEMLSESHAIGCRLFGDLQRARIPSEVTFEKVYHSLEKLSAHHAHIQKVLQEHAEELVEMQRSFEETLTEQESTASFSTLYTELKHSLDSKLMNKIKEEVSYKYLLENFNRAYDLFNAKKYVRLEIDLHLFSHKEWVRQLLQLEIDRAFYLMKTASVNDFLLKELLKEKNVENEPNTPQPDSEALLEPLKVEHCLYRFENNRIIMEDPECNLNISEEFIPEDPAGKIRLVDKEGNLKFESYRKEGKLHGPSRAYSPKGALLAEAWYLNGLQEGKSFHYHPSGVLYSIQNFKNGYQQGKQDYFYENQKPRLLITHYEHGVLDGDVFIFHTNGTMARKVHFSAGKHDGADLMWYANGIPFVEAYFNQNRPSGIARMWHANGQLAQQTLYDENFEMISTSHWDEAANPILSNVPTKDFFQDVAASTQQLTTTLTVLFKELATLSPLLTGMQGTALSENETPIDDDLKAIAENLNFIGAAITDLEKFNTQLIQEASNDQSQTEAFWKTGALQKEVQQKLNSATEQMQNELLTLRSTLTHTVEALLRKSISDKNTPEGKSENEGKGM